MLSDLAAALRDAADKVEAQAATPTFARQEINLVEAGQILAEHLNTVCVRVDYWPKTNGDGTPRLRFEIWDGFKHHAACSLRDAVNLCVAAAQANRFKATDSATVNGVLEAVGAAPDPNRDMPF
jgi:hypothetical protein